VNNYVKAKKQPRAAFWFLDEIKANDNAQKPDLCFKNY